MTLIGGLTLTLACAGGSVSRSLLLLNRSVSRFLLTLLRTSASVWKPIANATGGGTWIGGEGRTGEILESTPGSEFMY